MEGYVVTQPEGGRRLHDGWGGITYAPDVDVVVVVIHSYFPLRSPCSRMPAHFQRNVLGWAWECEGESEPAGEGRRGGRSGRGRKSSGGERTRKIYDLDLGERGG